MSDITITWKEVVATLRHKIFWAIVAVVFLVFLGANAIMNSKARDCELKFGEASKGKERAKGEGTFESFPSDRIPTVTCDCGDGSRTGNRK